MPALSKPTNGTNADYANRIGLLFDAFNNGNYNFPATQVPSADANTLDDYEEGTWTPSIGGSTTNGTHTYSYRVGVYTKIGREVYIKVAMLMTAKDAALSGVVLINGIPFTAATITNLNTLFALHGRITLAAGYSQLGGSVQTGAVRASLVQSGSNVDMSDITDAAVVATSSIFGGGSYIAA